jgi:histidinol-phosphate aminotransferase
LPHSKGSTRTAPLRPSGSSKRLGSVRVVNNLKTSHSLVRALVRKLHPYIPGEQPRIKGLVKLNTNENPYPPAPAVLQAVRDAVDDRLRLYPNPTAQPLRERVAKLHGCKPASIIIGNGSDEMLAMAVRCFVEPASAGTPRYKSLVQYFRPSYSLYPVLADIHGATKNPVPLPKDFSLPDFLALKKGGRWDPRAALTFVTTPNAPSGCGYATTDLEALCRAQEGVVVLDEAYVDFAAENAMRLALKYPHVLVARTFSKAYSLCFLRVGYFVGHPELIQALDKIRDSYNVNGLGQLAALTTLDHLPYYSENFRLIIATRQELSSALSELGFEVLPSQTNFILARPPGKSAKAWLEMLRQRTVLVRWFNDPTVRDFLRITIGTPAEARALLAAVRSCLER